MKMLTMFVLSFPRDPSYQKLAEAVNGLDYPEIESAAHALKGVSANLGFEKLQAACSDVVLYVRQDKPELVPSGFEKLKAEYEKVIREIVNIE